MRSRRYRQNAKTDRGRESQDALLRRRWCQEKCKAHQHEKQGNLMKHIIQAVVVVSLVAGSQAALAFPSSGDDVFTQSQSSYADRHAVTGAPAMVFPTNGDEVTSIENSTYTDRHSNKAAPAMVFPSSGDDIIWGRTSPRA
jgi:hypothetical protein